MTDPSPDMWKRLASRRLLTHVVASSGRARNALLYVPQHARRRGGLPLVLVLHGGASNPETIARRSAMHLLAETQGFLVAYPRGTPGASKTNLTWNPAGNADARRTNDTRFLRALIDDLEREYDVDPHRIYLTGFSIGGSLVYELAGLMADRIAAMAVVSGTMTADPCVPSRPVPLMHIHGTADRRVPLEGGHGPATARLSGWRPVRDGIEFWREINRCTMPPEPIRPTPDGVIAHRYVGTADVELWLVEGGAHVWPGARPSAADADWPAFRGTFSATAAIWDFFSAQAGRPRGAPVQAGPIERDTARSETTPAR